MKFIFKGYDSNIEKGEVLFHYQIRGDINIDFTEKISFPRVDRKIPQTLLKSILDNLMLILGISYWKLYCPKKIIIEGNFLTKEQAEFWNTVYAKGLGEFFYKNMIDFRGLVNFPYIENPSNSTSLSTPVKQASSSFQSSAPRKDRILLGLGGGKDSIVAAEILKKQNKDFDLFTVGTSRIQEEVSGVIGKKPIVIRRELDSKLFDLNEQKGSYNGHIPISAIYAFLGLAAAVFYDYRYIVVSNEKSANYENVTYLGTLINHQWSKSEEFERLFTQYVQKFITPDISYYSILRNLNELEVTKEFIKYPKYFEVFSSCNRNFKIGPSTALRTNPHRIWCGECAKCLFVFTLLCAFLTKKEVISIFGKNLFQDEALLLIFKELLGLKDVKPFECVGTPIEMKEALFFAFKRKEFNSGFLMKAFIKDVLPSLSNIKSLEKELFSLSNQHLIREDFQDIIEKL